MDFPIGMILGDFLATCVAVSSVCVRDQQRYSYFKGAVQFFYLLMH